MKHGGAEGTEERGEEEPLPQIAQIKTQIGKTKPPTTEARRHGGEREIAEIAGIAKIETKPLKRGDAEARRRRRTFRRRSAQMNADQETALAV